MADSWEAASAAMSPDERLAALAAELSNADRAIALFPRSRRWRSYRAACWAAMRQELARQDAIAGVAAPLSVDDLAAELLALS